MSNITTLHPQSKPARPVIDRDPYHCLMHLSQALAALEDLTALEMISESNEQLNGAKREDLASLFAVLHDYAEAARNVMPEEVKQ